MTILRDVIRAIIVEAIDDASKTRTYVLFDKINSKFLKSARVDMRYCVHGVSNADITKRRFLYIEGNNKLVNSMRIYYAHDYITHRVVYDANIEQSPDLQLSAYKVLHDDDIIVASDDEDGSDNNRVLNIDKLERIVNIAKSIDELIVMLMRMGEKREIDYTA